MYKVHAWKRIHLVGIGGINMSAVAKLLLASGAALTGSDLAASEFTDELKAKGVKIAIGPHDERNVQADCQAVIHTSASREDNPECLAAKHRHLPDISNFEFLGEWFIDKDVVLVTGTHGKSTTTALLGSICTVVGLDPTIVIGSKVAAWPDANLRIGQSNWVIIEGDEYAKHFLSFHPTALIINNIELDHTDVFKDMEDVRHTFERLLRQTKRGAVVVANGESEEVMKAVRTIKMHEMKVIRFGRQETIKLPSQAYEAVMNYNRGPNVTNISIKYNGSERLLQTPLIGGFNAMNITAAAVMAKELGVKDEAIESAVKDFKGLWRRMELIGEQAGVPVYSDYGHHPTAVRETLAAIKQAFPDKRIVLCFQPHHKNRTKHLFDELAICFDQADVLVLCEIYDVPGRSAPEDADMTSQKLLAAVDSHLSSADSQRTTDDRRLKITEYAADPEAAVKQTFALLKPGDICIVMGAGDIDAHLREQMQKAKSKEQNSGGL